MEEGILLLRKGLDLSCSTCSLVKEANEGKEQKAGEAAIITLSKFLEAKLSSDY